MRQDPGLSGMQPSASVTGSIHPVPPRFGAEDSVISPRSDRMNSPTQRSVLGSAPASPVPQHRVTQRRIAEEPDLSGMLVSSSNGAGSCAPPKAGSLQANAWGSGVFSTSGAGPPARAGRASPIAADNLRLVAGRSPVRQAGPAPGWSPTMPGVPASRADARRG